MYRKTFPNASERYRQCPNMSKNIKARPKTFKNYEELRNNPKSSESFRTCPNASKCMRARPNTSERVQSGPPRPSDAISIEPNGIPNRPNRKTQKIRVSVFRHFFGLQASYRAETLTPDRSRAPRHGQKIEKSAKLPNRPNRSTRSTDRATDRTDRRPP